MIKKIYKKIHENKWPNLSMNDFVAEQKLQMTTPGSELERKVIESSKNH